jgi:hypothetical protein
MQWQRSNFLRSIEVEPLFHGGEKAANHLQIAATIKRLKLIAFSCCRVLRRAG